MGMSKDPGMSSSWRIERRELARKLPRTTRTKESPAEVGEGWGGSKTCCCSSKGRETRLKRKSNQVSARHVSERGVLLTL